MAEIEAFDYEALLGQFAGALDAERNSQWRAGDIVARALDDLDAARRAKRLKRGEYRSTRSALLGGMAQIGHCSKGRVLQLAAVSGAFGTEQRYPERAWSFYRLVLSRARVLQLDPRALLDEAVDGGWSMARLRQHGKVAPDSAGLDATCDDCGATLRLRVEGSRVTAFCELPALPCPLCIARKWRDEQDAREAPRLGVLGVV